MDRLMSKASRTGMQSSPACPRKHWVRGRRSIVSCAVAMNGGLSAEVDYGAAISPVDCANIVPSGRSDKALRRAAGSRERPTSNSCQGLSGRRRPRWDCGRLRARGRADACVRFGLLAPHACRPAVSGVYSRMSANLHNTGSSAIGAFDPFGHSASHRADRSVRCNSRVDFSCCGNWRSVAAREGCSTRIIAQFIPREKKNMADLDMFLA